MKKIIISLFLTLFMLAPAIAGEIEILPTMQSKTNVQDRVWVGTFQIVWNDLMDKVVHNVIKFPDGTPCYVNELNKQEFTVEDLSEKCFYRYCGKITKNTKKTIVKAIKKRFNETSDILDKLDLTPDDRRLLIYAMLKKDFQFTQAFDKLGNAPFRDTTAEFFGITGSSEAGMRDGVKVLFYNSPSDYAVVLSTKTNDEVYLYKTPTTRTFNYIYADMLKKAESYKGDVEFQDIDRLKVPNLKFFEEKSFDELSGKRIKGTQIVIDQAMETVKFEMDNTGVKLKSEAAMTMMKCSLPAVTPRYFYFDDTFVVFLKEKEKKTPYFALRVHDISKFQK